MVFNSVAASDCEVLPFLDTPRIGVDGLSRSSTPVHSSEEVPIDRSDGVLIGPSSEGKQLEDLPIPGHRRIGMDGVGRPITQATPIHSCEPVHVARLDSEAGDPEANHGEFLPCPDTRRIGVDRVRCEPTPVHSGEVVPVERLDGTASGSASGRDCHRPDEWVGSARRRHTSQAQPADHDGGCNARSPHECILDVHTSSLVLSFCMCFLLKRVNDAKSEQVTPIMSGTPIDCLEPIAFAGHDTPQVEIHGRMVRLFSASFQRKEAKGTNAHGHLRANCSLVASRSAHLRAFSLHVFITGLMYLQEGFILIGTITHFLIKIPVRNLVTDGFHHNIENAYAKFAIVTGS